MRFERLVVVAFFMIQIGAHAASFDCSHAKSSVEKAICADARLGQIDQEIGDTYFKIEASLDRRFRNRFRSVQRAWLKERNGAVDLKTSLEQRLVALKNSFVTVNSITFLQLSGIERPPYLITQLPGASSYNQWVDRIWNDAASDLADSGRYEKCDALANSLTDGALDEEARQRVQGKVDEGCEGLTVTSRYYAIDFVSPDFMSVHESTSASAWHAAHPANDDFHHNWWLSKSGKIEPSDIFATHDYTKVVKKHVEEYLKDNYAGARVSSETVLKTALAPINWALTPKFFRITGQGYDYNVGRGFVQFDIPWEAFNLRPGFLAMLQSAQPVTDPRLVLPSP